MSSILDPLPPASPIDSRTNGCRWGQVAVLVLSGCGLVACLCVFQWGPDIWLLGVPGAVAGLVLLPAFWGNRGLSWSRRLKLGCLRLLLVGFITALGLACAETYLRYQRPDLLEQGSAWVPALAENPKPGAAATNHNVVLSISATPPTASQKPNPHFSSLDYLKIWNRKFVEQSAPERFANWPIPLETFEADRPQPRYLFKPNLRLTRRDMGVADTENCRDEVIRGTNSWGFRGPEFSVTRPAGCLRIVCLGASTTEGSQFDPYTYPYFLQEALQQLYPKSSLEVINAGHHGQDLTDLIELFRLRVAPLEPDLVLLFDGGFVHYPEWLQETGPQTEPAPRLWWLYQNSALFTLLADRLEFTDALRPMTPHTLNLTSSKPSLVRRQQQLRQLAQVVRAHGSQLILSSCLLLAHDGFRPRYADNPGIYKDLYIKRSPFTGGELDLVNQDLNRATAAIAAECGLRYADVAADFPREPRYFAFDLVHMTQEGDRKLAELFAQYLAHEVLRLEGDRLVITP